MPAVSATLTAPDPLVLLLLLISPAVGSFLGVLVDRLPRGAGVVRPRSACRSCAQSLGPRDLIPVLSYVLARGRCRHCGATIPPWLLYLEITAPGLAVLAVLAANNIGGGVAHIWLTAVVLWLLLALAVADLVWMRLPDLLTGGLLVAALGRAALQGDGAVSLSAAALGAVIGAGSFWIIRHTYARARHREGLGAGDVKLMAGIGAFCGPFLLPHAVLAAALMALAGVGIQALLARRWPDGAARVPFGAALCGGAALVWLLRAAGL